MNSLSLTIDTRKLLSCSVVFFISAVSSLLFIYFYSRLTSLSLCNTSLQAFPSVRLDALRYHITISNLPIVLEPSYTHLCRNRKHEIHSHSLLRPVLGLLPLQDTYGGSGGIEKSYFAEPIGRAILCLMLIWCILSMVF